MWFGLGKCPESHWKSKKLCTEKLIHFFSDLKHYAELVSVKLLVFAILNWHGWQRYGKKIFTTRDGTKMRAFSFCKINWKEINNCKSIWLFDGYH